MEFAGSLVTRPRFSTDKSRINSSCRGRRTDQLAGRSAFFDTLSARFPFRPIDAGRSGLKDSGGYERSTEAQPAQSAPGPFSPLTRTGIRSGTKQRSSPSRQFWATHANRGTEGFERVVRDWRATARQQPYTDVIYQPKSNYYRTCEQTISESTLFREVGLNSCHPGLMRSAAFRPNRW